MTVAYDPADPPTIFTDANGSMGGMAWLGILLGVVFTVIGVGILVGTAMANGLVG